MKQIEKRMYRYIGMAALGVALCAAMSISSAPTMQDARILLFVAALVTTLLVVFSIQDYGRLKAARLIVDNKILHIRPAVIDVGHTANAAEASSSEGIDIFVSCFGILLESRVIKFNQDGIRLKSVDLGQDFIFLTYGADKLAHSALLLHDPLGISEREKIARSFRSETGVVPKILN